MEFLEFLKKVFEIGFNQSRNVLKNTSQNPKQPEIWVDSLTKGAESVAKQTSEAKKKKA